MLTASKDTTDTLCCSLYLHIPLQNIIFQMFRMELKSAMSGDKLVEPISNSRLDSAVITG